MDEKIKDWSPEHHTAVKNVVFETAFRHRDTYHNKIPSRVVVVGDNWLFSGKVAFDDDGVPPWVPLDAPRGYSVHLHDQRCEYSSQPRPLDDVLRYVGRQFGDQHCFALIPASSKRAVEAASVGQRSRLNDDWYDVRFDGTKIIRVFPLLEK